MNCQIALKPGAGIFGWRREAGSRSHEGIESDLYLFNLL
jgi:hypothetical protein